MIYYKVNYGKGDVWYSDPQNWAELAWSINNEDLPLKYNPNDPPKEVVKELSELEKAFFDED